MLEEKLLVWQFNRGRTEALREIKIIVQFGQTDQGASCVVQGNYGYSVVVK